MGDKEFLKVLTAQNEPRLGPRVYSGAEMPLERIAPTLCRQSGIAVGPLCRAGKGTRRLTEIREKFVYAATRIMFHKPAEASRFL